MRSFIFSFSLLIMMGFAPDKQHYPPRAYKPWREGYLDIHHINTGRGNAAFFIFPDGTTMLVDAGAVEQDIKKNFYPVRPDDTRRPGEWIAAYIQRVAPALKKNKLIDYAVISHFHNDHFGEITPKSPFAQNGGFQLSGITDVEQITGIETLIDRGYPDYDYPVPVSGYHSDSASFKNYLEFVRHKVGNGKMKAEKLVAGAHDQIRLKYNPRKHSDFSVRNVKANESIWTGINDETARFVFDPPLVNALGKYNENPLSLVLKISYGKFDYYTGGDTPGVNDWPDYDIETTVANVVGEVEALTLNHHGYKDATNQAFLDKLSPQVIVQQNLHDPHFQDNVLRRIETSSAKVFALNASENVQANYRDIFRKSYLSYQGHVLIRVFPKGEKYQVIVLDDASKELLQKSEFGPYFSKDHGAD